MAKQLSQILKNWEGARHMLKELSLHLQVDISQCVAIMISSCINIQNSQMLHLVQGLIWYGLPTKLLIIPSQSDAMKTK
jgi:hypothetical protein